jgi:hypothetical protein
MENLNIFQKKKFFDVMITLSKNVEQFEERDARVD